MKRKRRGGGDGEVFFLKPGQEITANGRTVKLLHVKRYKGAPRACIVVTEEDDEPDDASVRVDRSPDSGENVG